MRGVCFPLILSERQEISFLNSGEIKWNLNKQKNLAHSILHTRRMRPVNTWPFCDCAVTGVCAPFILINMTFFNVLLLLLWYTYTSRTRTNLRYIHTHTHTTGWYLACFFTLSLKVWGGKPMKNLWNFEFWESFCRIFEVHDFFTQEIRLNCFLLLVFVVAIGMHVYVYFFFYK